MSNLDRIYDLNLDLLHKVQNDKMEFSLNDVNTSMFYVTFTRNRKEVLDLKDKLVTFYMVKPNKSITSIDLQYDRIQERFYCDLTDEYKDIKGNYVGQIIVSDSITGERIVVPTIISYMVVTDILENISDDNTDEEEQIAILENLIKEVSLLKTKIKENTNEISNIKSNYTTKTYVDNAIKNVNVTEQLKDYAKKTDLHSHSNKSVLEIINSTYISNWNTAYTHSQSAHAPSNAQKNSDITKAEIEAKLTGNITTHTHTIPSEFITETELENKKYATESYVTSEITKAQLGGDGEVNLEGYATKEYVDDEIAKIQIDDELKDRVYENELNINKILEVVDEPPIYVSPTLTLSLSKSTLEHNVETSLVITPSYTKNDAGDVESYELKRNEETIYTHTTPIQYTDTVTISHGSSLEYQAITKYKDGEIKTTTFGIAYPSTSIKAGQVSAKKTITSYAKTYYGVIDGSTITLEDVSKLTSKSNTSKSNTITYNLTRQRSVLMYPKSFGVLTSIKDSNNFDYINSYNRSELTYNEVAYYVYILIDPVTITGFKQTFN